MAPRTRQDNVQKLKFKDKLVKAGQSTDSLIKKIKTLHTELSEMDQDLVDRESLTSIRKELISTSVLLHKDKGVKAYVACCLADLLRLYAPDAPYTAHELRDIFQFFNRQITTGLKGTDSPYAAQYYYLLESLSSIKSIVLVCDLPHADELMSEIFRDLFDLVRQNDIAKNVEMFMADIMVALIDEAQTIPSELLETVLAQFLQKNPRMEQAAYRLAVDVCGRTADRLQRNVCQYFTDTILSHSDTTEEDLDQIRAAHDLIKALNKGCPALLLNVVPQLEEELRVDRVQLRVLATQVLGEMFSEPKNGLELSRKYPSAWQCWLQRKTDKAPSVRLAFVEACKGIVTGSLPELRTDIEESLETKLLDPDDKVRAATCALYAQIDYESALHHVSVKQLREVGERCLDKKRAVRMEAFTCLGKLYRSAYSEIESNDPLAVQQFGWIPDRILRASLVSTDVRSEAEYILHQYVLPLPSKVDKPEDEAAWAEQLLHVTRDLDDKGLTALLSLTNLKTPRPSPYEKFMECCKNNNGGIIDKNEEEIARALSRAIQWLSRTFSDPSSASDALQAFAKANESRLYKLAAACMDPKSDLKTVVKSMNEFLRRIEQAIPSALDTMTTLIRRASYCIINQSTIPALIKRLQKDKNRERDNSQDPDGLFQSEPPTPSQTQTQTQPSQTQLVESQTQALANESTRMILGERAQSILTYISKACPGLYTSHVTELSRAIYDDKNMSVRVVEVGLQAYSAAVRADPNLAPTDKRTVNRLAAMVKENNPRIAKYAARVLVHSKTRTELCEKLVEDLAESLTSAESSQLISHLAALAQFALCVPKAFEKKSDIILMFVVKEIILIPSPAPEDDHADNEWIEDGQLTDATRSKILAIKICVNRCMANAHTSLAQQVSPPVFKMLWRLIECDGSVDQNANDDPRIKTRVRLQAALSLLKISTIEAYCRVVTTKMPSLAVVIQDTCFNVRQKFLSRVVTLLASRKLDARFNVIPFMTAHDPEKEIRDMARSYVITYYQKASKDVRVINFETILIRLLHLLAHHPDFSTEVDQLADSARYIEFYVDIIASAENVSLLYHLAMKAKSIRDSESDQYSQNLYVMSELAQSIIKTRAKSQQWTLTSYPGRLELPSDIFRQHKTPADASKTLKTVYLPDEAASVLDGIGKHWRSPNKLQQSKPARKRKEPSAKTSANGAKSKRPRRRKHDSETDTDSSASDEDEDILMKSEGEKEEDNDDEGQDSGQDGSSPKLGRGGRRKAKAKTRKAKRR